MTKARIGRGGAARAGSAAVFVLTLASTWSGPAPSSQAALLPPAVPSTVTPGSGSPSDLVAERHPALPSNLAATLSGLPLYFIENHGQVDSRFAYYVEGSETSAYFARDGVTFILTDATEDAEPVAQSARSTASTTSSTWGVTLGFEDANPLARLEAAEKSATVVSYFRGGQDEWKAGLPTYQNVVYRELWPGIDLVYSGTATRIKYTFVVQPGADPGQIRLVYRGARSVTLTEDGSLKVSTPVGGFEDDAPYAYQEEAGAQEPVEVAFAPEADGLPDAYRYGFRVGRYDRSRPLILDPVVLAFAGYIGGTAGTTALEERADAVAVDSNGDIYIAGSTPSNSLAGPLDGQFPTGSAWIGPGGPGQGNWTDGGGANLCTGAVASCRTSYNGPGTGGTGTDAFVAKVKGDGSEFIYVVYLGGTCAAADTTCRDYAHAIAVDSAGSAYVAGRTNSTEADGFPVSGAADAYFRRTYRGGSFDGFVCKISDDAVRGPGSDLDYCGYIGGTELDEIRGIAVDGAGAAYVVGSTQSDERTNGPSPGRFPVKVGPDLTFNNPGSLSNDVFVAKVQASGVSLDYCGYLGGLDGETGWGIAVDASGNAYITGYTQSDEFAEGFPTQVGPDLTFNVGAQGDAFVAKVQATGVGFDYVGYIGGASFDWGYGIDVDNAGNAYVVGQTSSDETTFPVLVGPDLTYNDVCCETDAFVAKVQATGAGLDYSGYVGGDKNDIGQAIVVDRTTGEAYVTGYTLSDETTFPVLVGPDLTYNGTAGDDDAFVAKVQANPVDNQGGGGDPGLDYAGYIGGGYVDRAYGIALDPSGDVFVVGTTSSREDPACGNFPAQNFVDTTFNSLVACLSTQRDAFVAKISGGPKRLYRSVGINPANLNTGGRTVEITGSTAIFSGPMPDNVGVGDVLTYASGGNRLAFITGRSSTTTFTVADKDGAPPTAAPPTTPVGVYRAYNSLANWESGIENPNILEPTENDVNPSMDLVTAGTVMLVPCYADGEDVGSVYINSWETGPDNYIRIYTPVFPTEVGASQRHNGTWDTSAYRLSQDASYFAVIGIRERYVRIDGLQLNTNQIVSTESNGIHGGNSNADLPVEIHVSNCIVRSTTAALPDVAFGIGVLSSFGTTTMDSSLYVGKLWNNIIYGYVGASSSTGIYAAQYGTLYAYNNTVVGTGLATHRGIAEFNNTIVHAKNNISIDSADPYLGTFSADSTNNFSDLGDAPGLNPKTRDGAGADPVFVGGVDYHLDPTDTWAQDQGADLSGDPDLLFVYDIDLGARQVPWDIGADDLLATTAVELLSFEALPADSVVELSWRTASELDNLGFHLHRALSEAGPWTRITPSLIPGLGSSPEGASYSFRDTSLVNGVRYFYRLEDIDAHSGSTFHGPVSAVPSAPSAADDGGSGSSDGSEDDPASDEGDPSSDEPTGESAPRTYGRPGDASFEIVSRTGNTVVLELRTPGFVATPSPEGLHITVPGFDQRTDPRAPDLPLKRVVLDAVVGRHARIVHVLEEENRSFPGLTPAAVGAAEILTSPDGTVRPGRHATPLRGEGLLPPFAAGIAGDAFIGETKKLALEMNPLRYDASTDTLLLTRRLRVRIAFDRGTARRETGRGSHGRRRPRAVPGDVAPRTLAYLHTLSRGLHAASFERLFPQGHGALLVDSLRLSLQGDSVPFHVEPKGRTFGPGSVLFFYASIEARSTDYSPEIAYALEKAPGGLAMRSLSASPRGGQALVSGSLADESFEANRFYQAGLVEAPDPWLWDFVVGGMSKSFPIGLEGLDPTSSEPAQVQVFLQGASEADIDGEHHLRLSLNGTHLGETTFDGKLPHVFSTSVPVSVLSEGENTLTVTNVGDTGAKSFVFLDRVEVVHPQTSALRLGRFGGVFLEEGEVVVGGGATFGVDVTDPKAPAWLASLRPRSNTVSLDVEAGHRYDLASPEGLLVPLVSAPLRSTLRDTSSQAEYVLIAPEAFMEAARPLAERRRDQGLTTKVISLEEITSQFGHGRASAEAIRDFLAYAYHSWRQPSARYVLLLGDSSYDPRDFTGLDQGAPLPALWVKTSYLWTASDPTLGAVNGEDLLPDVAVGRLPAKTLAEAHALVQKVLAWEEGGQDLSGTAVLVADNPDKAGDFEADLLDIRASFLGGRETKTFFLRELGGSTRAAILGSLDEGAALLSYAGHGGPAVWASENVLNSWDTGKLLARSAQPLMLTFNCLNGYFVAPNYDSLSEAFLKVEGRGTIGAFSPSGLSLDGPAHQLHRALMAEITGGGHERLGDAVLAAQSTYAETGLMPELLAIYHLFGDPALSLR